MTTATQSGIASWFFFGSALTNDEANALKAGSSGNYNNVTVSPFVTGSIGTLGSGADLEIADKNIVAGVDGGETDHCPPSSNVLVFGFGS